MTTAAAWISLAWLLAAPSEKGSAVLLGFSEARLSLALVVLSLSLLFTWFTWRAWKVPSWLAKHTDWLGHALAPSYRFWASLLIFVSVFLISWTLLFLPVDRANSLIGPNSLYLSRLRPLFLFGIVFGLVFSALIVFQRYGMDLKALRGQRAIFRTALFIFVFLLVVWGAVLVTGLGLGFDATIWNAPGAPLLSSQVFLCIFAVFFITAFVFALRRRFPNELRTNRIDLVLAIAVWLVAALFWLRQPAQPTYYTSIPRPPNFESYPLSDAFNHDVIANNVLVGQGFHFGGLVAVRRPLYVMLLAGLEAIFGPHYDLVTTAQVIILALFPAVLYLLGAKLHNRLSGLMVASFITFRETNSIALGHVINTSHAKMLMADLPTALAMAALALAAVVWLRGPARNGLTALLTGGLLGAFILLRSQTLTLTPFFILLAILVWGWRAGWRPGLFFLLGVMLVASPWIIRNRVGMGQWAIEDSVVSGFLANRYRFDPGTFGLPFLPGETEGEYYARQMTSVREFALQNPGYVASFLADNFVRNQLLNFMALPVSWQLRDLEAHVRQLPYWPSWDGRLAAESALPMLVNLLLVSLGLSVAWRRARWAGFVPLFINIGFTLNLALARVSGWRYNLPVDWTILFYFALSISELFVGGMLLLRKNKKVNEFRVGLAKLAAKKDRKVHLPGRMQWAFGLLAFLLIGNSFLIIEAISHPRYQKLTASDVETMLGSAVIQAGDEARRAQLKDQLNANRMDLLYGRALYPTFYRAGEGDPITGFSLTIPLDFKRVTFYLVGPEAASVVLRVNNPSIDFPSGSDVLVLRCGSDAPEAAAVIVSPSDQLSELFISADLEKACPELGS